jgi:hypothetical protein
MSHDLSRVGKQQFFMDALVLGAPNPMTFLNSSLRVKSTVYLENKADSFEASASMSYGQS